IAAGDAYDARGVFGSVDVAVTNDGNAHGLLDGRDEVPVGGASVALGAGARVNGYGFDARFLCQLGNVYGDDGVFVPAGAELDGERDFHRGTDGAEDFAEQWKIAKE